MDSKLEYLAWESYQFNWREDENLKASIRSTGDNLASPGK